MLTNLSNPMRPRRLFRGWFAPAEQAPPPPETVGLQAFASEASASDGVPEPAGHLPAAVRSHLLLAVLATLVVLEAVPAFLWLRDRFEASSAVVSAAEALPPSPFPAPIAAAACEPAVVPEPPARPVAAASRPAPAPAPPGTVAGLISVAAPVPMRVYARGKLVGTTEAETIMLPVGTHELEFTSDAVGYRVSQTVTVQPGRTSRVQLEAPSGILHVNALPWAEVWIDNQRVGQTPLGNLPAPIGSRDVVFRHPELGERRTTVLVTLKGPARVSMDLRQKP